MKFRKRMCLIIYLIFVFFSIICRAETEQNKFEIIAPSAILIEQSSGKILFEKNAHEVRHVASLMKIMNLFIALRKIEEGKINLKDKIVIDYDIPKSEGSNIWLKQGETITVQDLIKAISMVSANDACISLAKYISGDENKFISKMNDYANNLNLTNTTFKNCIGEDEEGNITTARDIAYLTREVMKYENNTTKYTSSWIDHIRDKKTQLVNTNKLIKIYPGTTGIKTGTSKEAGSCICATAEKNNLKLIGVVLGCKDLKERTNEITKLLDYGFSEYSMMSPELPDNLPKIIPIKNGIDSQIEVNACIDESFPVSNKDTKNFYYEIVWKENIEAPIQKGEKVGEIIYRQNDELVYTCDILSNSNVEKIKFLPTFRKLLFNILSL